VSAGQHPLIHLMTYSEVISVEGEAGAFHVTVKKKPRYVDEDKCRGCGLCAEACRMTGRIPNTFNQGLGKRAAIYVAFPQAVPLVYTVDPQACLFLTRGVCGKTFKCKDACTSGAINFDQKEELIELAVSTIIVATGFDLMDPRLKPEFGYGVYPHVMTGLEFERMSSASGPTAGEITVNGKKPQDVVFIHCVGSRDPHTGVPYCSRICCMYTAKHAHLVRDKLPEAHITAFYMDVRAFGKGYEEFYTTASSTSACCIGAASLPKCTSAATGSLCAPKTHCCASRSKSKRTWWCWRPRWCLAATWHTWRNCLASNVRQTDFSRKRIPSSGRWTAPGRGFSWQVVARGQRIFPTQWLKPKARLLRRW